LNLLTKHNHLKETISLSIPLVLTQIGHIITGMVDNIFLGKLGKTEQAAGILSNNLFVVLLVFSIGMSYVLTPAITEMHVKQNEKEKASLFKNGLYLNMLVAILLFIVLFFSSPLLAYMQQPMDVVKLAIPFFDVLIFSIIPVALFFVCKQYTEGLSNTRAAMYFSVIGNILNIILNYCLIYGKVGLPELGYMGSCWATFIARTFMGVGFLIFLFYNPSVNSFARYYKEAVINAKQFWMLFKDGLASALQFTFEVAAFAIAGLIAGVFGKESIDAHGIALNLAAFTYMFSSGIGSASTIRVGNYYTKQDWPNLKLAIKTSYMLSIYVMGFMALSFMVLNTVLPQVFTNETEIIKIASKLLIFAAIFQLFDGTQVVAVGVLRGMEDYAMPSYIAFVAYWLISLPLAYVFAFTCDYKVYGVWLSLTLSLVFVAAALFFRIKYLVRKKTLAHTLS
jgi:multidrug resistance protein, MATE family